MSSNGIIGSELTAELNKQFGDNVPAALADFVNRVNVKPPETLVIIGKGVSAAEGIKRVREGGQRHVWTLNDAVIPETSLHWQIHERKWDADQVLLDHSCDVMVRKKADNMAHDRQTIWNDKYLQGYPRDYLTSTIAYMLAYAIALTATGAQRFEVIELWGVDLDPRNRVESEYERPCIEYYIGYAEGRGIAVVTPPELLKTSSLFTSEYAKRLVYGKKKPFKLVMIGGK